MLNTIHVFASERLEESRETQGMLKRYTAWYASLIGEANPDLTGDELIKWLNQITIEYKNIEKALKWALLGENDIQTGIKMVSALGNFWRNKYRLAEGQEWLTTALEFADHASVQDLGNIYEAAGYIVQNLGNIKVGRTFWENALKIQRSLGDKSRIAGLLISLSHPVLGLEGISIEKTMEGIELARQIGDKRQIAHGLNVLGEIFRLQNDYESAKQVYEECLNVAREANDRIREVLNIANLGLVAFNQGEYKLARAFGLEAYKLALEINNDYIKAEGLSSNGGFLAALGDMERGTKLLGAGDKQLAEIGAKSQFTDQIEFNKMEQLIRHQVDDETYHRWYAEGQKLTLDEAIKLVLQEV
jgi:tetratricopeptide (TPR) repeat protein